MRDKLTKEQIEKTKENLFNNLKEVKEGNKTFKQLIKIQKPLIDEDKNNIEIINKVYSAIMDDYQLMENNFEEYEEEVIQTKVIEVC